MKKIAIVILNFNGRHFLEKFLPGVIKHSPGCRVIVADNCSTDDSLHFLSTHHPEVEIIKNPVNKGFSHGYNLALSQLKDVDYYVLLNSDVEVTENWITPVIQMLDKDPEMAAAQPKILDYNKKTHFEYAGAGGGFLDTLGYPFCRGRVFLHLEEDLGQFDDQYQIFWATGACLFIKADIYHEMSGLDEDFFAHMEEIDLCWRLNCAGYKVYYNGASTVYHVGGGTLDRSNPRKTYYNFRNGLALLYKNYPNRDLWLKFPIRIILDIIAAFKFMFFDSLADGFAVFRAHIDFILEFGSNYRKRQQTKALKKTDNISTLYKGSVVWDYFIRGKRKFSQLFQ